MSNENHELNELLKQHSDITRATKMGKSRGGHGQAPTPDYGSDVAENGEEKLTGLVQWTTHDGKRYIPASHTAKNLVPGAYEICHAQGIGLYFQRFPVKTEGLLRFPQTNSERVVKEIQTFWEKEDLFREYSLAYKRGIMLWGPPGSGKSCTIQLIMKDVIEREGIVIKFGHPTLFTEGMRVFREIEPTTPAVVLMEDIDSTLEMHNESEVLNILDGVDHIERLVFLACPAPETRILKTDLTWVRADTLSAGNQLIAFDEHGPNRKYRTATVRSCPIVDRVRYKVITDGGEIVVSEEHPFLIKLGNRPHEWRIVQKLRPGNKIAAIGSPWSGDNSYNAGYLAGQYDGEGTLNFYESTTSGLGFRVSWVQAEGHIVDNVQKMLKERNFDVRQYRQENRGVGVYGPYKPKITLNVAGGLWENLRLLGMLRPKRLLAHAELERAWHGRGLQSQYFKVIAVERLGIGPVVALDTTTGTFIGEGMLQHNTTNYPERLGARILNRPSRFDKRFKIGHPNPESRLLYFKHIIGSDKRIKELKINLDKWVKDTEGFSIAHLKELFVAVTILGDDYAEAIETLASMRDNISSAHDDIGLMGFGLAGAKMTRMG